MPRTIVTLLLAALPAWAQAPLPHLKNYVNAKDDSYAWKLVDTADVEGNTIATIKLTSQKWQGELWEHDVMVFLPKGVKPSATMILMNDGGSAGTGRTAMGLALAQRARAPVAFVLGVPKQPLYGGKREDALIAETFIRYLETKDPTWPLLFPMVKSVVKGMDCVQAFAKQEWKIDVTGFVVTGASKRGWTTWLTAATGDSRVKAIAPMVFDSLNLLKQMPHQVECFGDYSLMIRDYKERKLLPLPETEEGRQLWAMVDPWVYRETLTLPKLILNGANDPYWTQDALNIYYGDLKGPKNVLYVPNAGHDLRVMQDPAATKELMKKDVTPLKAIDTIAAFSRCVIEGKDFPKIEATFTVNGSGQGHITATASVKPKAVRHWSAESDTKDFRKAKWTASEPIQPDENHRAAVLSKVNARHMVQLLEFEFALDGTQYFLSTPVQVVDAKK